MRGQKRILLRVLLTAMLAGAIFFIFWNSSATGPASGVKSVAVTTYANGLLDRVGVSLSFSEHVIRKIGHLTEYALLGLLICFTWRGYTPHVQRHISWALLLGLLVAVSDETFQLTVPGRSGQLTDVWIDWCGVLAGLGIGLLILLIASKLKHERRKGVV